MKKKLYKVLSVVLSVTLLLSVCFVSGAFNVFAGEKITDYYVKGQGTGDGSSVDSPAPNVETALKTMVAKGGLTADDAANIWIMQDAKELYGDSGKNHNLAYWGAPVEHNNVVYVKQYKSNTYPGGLKSTVLLDGKILGSGGGIVLGGPAVFEDIKIVYTHKTNYAYGTLIANGNDLTVNNSVSFAYINGNSVSNYTAEAGVTSLLIDQPGRLFSTRDAYIEENEPQVTYTEPFTLTINKGFASTGTNAIVVGDSNAIFKESVTIKADLHKNGTERIYIGNSGNYSTGMPAIYEKDINIKLRNTSSFNFNSGVNPTVYGGINMIVSDTAGFRYKPADAANDQLPTIANNKDGGPVRYWILNVSDSKYDSIDFYETGKFKVPAGSAATATNKATGTKYESDANGILDLSAEQGEYDVIVIQVKAKVYEYYVKGGGTGDGTSLGNPAPDVATVVNYINDCRLTAEETATVYILQDIEKPTLTGPENSVGSLAPHNLAAWGAPVSHDAKIIVKPHPSNALKFNDKVKTTYLASSRLAGDSSILFKMGGPTEFQDLMLVFSYGTWTGHVQDDRNIMVANGNDLTIGETVTFGNIHALSNSEGAWGQSGQIDELDMFGYSAGEPGNTYFDPFKITIKDANSYSGARIDIPGRDAGNYIYKSDVTIDIEGDQYGNSLRFGGPTAGTTTVIEKNLNIKFARGIILRFFNGSNNITVKGAYQVIESTDCAYSMSGESYDPIKDITTVKGVDGNTAPYYRLTVPVKYIDYIDFIEGETGKFAITHPELIAVATDENGNETPSINGVMDLSAVKGNYTVEFIESYTNNGQQISVYKETTIDLSKVTHNEMPGYAFIGWKLKNKDGSLSEVGSPVKLTLGDVLVAQYLELGKDFAIEEAAQIRDEGTLRFVINKTNEFSSFVPNAAEFGTILFATDATRGNEIYYDENVILEWIYDEEQEGLYGSHFVPGKGGTSSDKYQTENKPAIVLADNILEETEEGIKYTACITDISEEDYYTWFTARGFIKFTDYNGIDRVLYTEQSQSCMYKVAAETAEADLTDAEQAVIDYIDNYHTVAEYDKLYEKTYTYGADENGNITDPNRVIYTQNGLFVRDVAIDVDTLGGDDEAYEICFITDSHFNVLSTNDILNGSKYILGSYRGRYYYTYRRAYIVKQLAYASRFDRVVFGGDQFDYLSDGNLTSVDRMITKKSINGSVKMVLGNHESAEFCAPVDVVNAHEVLTLEEKYAQIQNYWANDTYIDGEIVKNKQGKAVAMMIYLDNSDEEYWQVQLDTLPTYFAEAREAGVPVFIYQHIPMLTMNPDETEVWYSGMEGSFAMNESESKNGEKVDFTSASGYMGDANSTQLTKDVCALIRKNADIVKGVFCGHTHENVYTEIVGLNADGTPNDLRIPQHNGFAGHRHGVMKITLK
jgi:hypothetical protein